MRAQGLCSEEANLLAENMTATEALKVFAKIQL